MSLAKIDKAVAKYPADQKQSAVMAALTIAQDEKGWLSTETMDFVAAYLGMVPLPPVYWAFIAAKVVSFVDNMHPVITKGIH